MQHGDKAVVCIGSRTGDLRTGGVHAQRSVQTLAGECKEGFALHARSNGNVQRTSKNILLGIVGDEVAAPRPAAPLCRKCITLSHGTGFRLAGHTVAACQSFQRHVFLVDKVELCHPVAVRVTDCKRILRYTGNDADRLVVGIQQINGRCGKNRGVAAGFGVVFTNLKSDGAFVIARILRAGLAHEETVNIISIAQQGDFQVTRGNSVLPYNAVQQSGGKRFLRLDFIFFRLNITFF